MSAEFSVSRPGVPPGGLAAKNQPQPAVEEHEATSLEVTRWEADALERFAPLVRATPRRLIRFVNVFRLIKKPSGGRA